ncbi:MAG: hypothetical protein QXG86_01680 [Candidatus Woesearchaeota archaeon]
MKNKKDFYIWLSVVMFFFVTVFIIFGFILKRVDMRTFCETESDCVCGGIDTKTGQCFIGNINYYEKYVDKTRQCPDFCGGIASNLEIRCEANKCVQRQKIVR